MIVQNVEHKTLFDVKRDARKPKTEGAHNRRIHSCKGLKDLQ